MENDLLFNLQLLHKQMIKCVELLKQSDLEETDRKAQELYGASTIVTDWCKHISES